MNVILQRTETSDEGTFGKLSFEGTNVVTVELPWRDNAKMISCIPPGIYPCNWRARPDGIYCYHVDAVPGREQILIHVGNFGGDKSKGYKSDVEGCIALGMFCGAMSAGRKPQRAVLNSRTALSFFEEKMGYHAFDLTVVDNLPR